MGYLLGFFLPLAILAVAIFLLGLLQYGINADRARDSNDKYNRANKGEEHIENTESNSVADAIHTYRAHREASERDQAQRERVTVIVLVFTAVFALLAAGAGIVSAWIFYGQLEEMRSSGERQLRAYVGMLDDISMKCPLCETVDIDKPIEIKPENILDNMILMTLQNGGQTPAYNVRIDDSYWSGKYGDRLPSGFKYPINVSSTQTPYPPASTGMLNPGQKTPGKMLIDTSVIPLIVRARRHAITVYYYGTIYYDDIFGTRRTTPFCFQYFPDYPADPFGNCPEHNTPEETK